MNQTFRHISSSIKWLTVAIIAVVFAACASMGHPEGGPRDYRPPIMVRSTPQPGSLNVTPQRIELYFDENVQLDDAFNKVVVSPTTKNTPVVRSLGRKVTVEFRDTLQAATTYTIDFADAIKDLNEGNVLDGLAIDFSTGPTIDTLKISGMVFEARNLEPAQGMTVAVTTDLSDTAFTKVPFVRIARTNQLGQFTVRNLKPGNYRVYAVNDVNRDRLWDRSEDIAFYSTVVSPSAHAATVTDTLRATDQSDSIVVRDATHFLPDDLLLTWFNEDFRSQYIKDHQRPDRRRIIINFAAKSDTLPTVKVVGGKANGKNLNDLALLAANPTRDSLTYWLKSTDVLDRDTLALSIEHLATDSLSQLSWKTDTINFVYRAPKQKKEDKKKKDNDTVPQVQPLTFQVLSTTSHELETPVMLRLTEPIERIDTTLFSLEMMVDTLWTPIKMPLIKPSPTAPLTEMIIDYPWEPGAKYRLSADSAAVYTIYNTPSAKLAHEFLVKKTEDYANLKFTVTAASDTSAMFVELLDPGDNVRRKSPVDSENIAEFKLVTPGTYYARVVFDRNNNGEWDTGNVAAALQPEDVAYYPKKIDLRANWDNELSWDVYATAIDMQKPYEIKKNRPKLKKGEKAPTDNDEELDEWGEPLNGTKRGNSNKFSIPGIGGNRQQSSGNSATIRR